MDEKQFLEIKSLLQDVVISLKSLQIIAQMQLALAEHESEADENPKAKQSDEYL